MIVIVYQNVYMTMEVASAQTTGPRIIVHGGAWAIPDVLKEASLNGVMEAAKIGYNALLKVQITYFGMFMESRKQINSNRVIAL